MSEAPKIRPPQESAEVLEKALGAFRGDLTIADAATKSGLPLRDAERGLHFLTNKYRGHLRVTEQGELLFRFPDGFTEPWITKGAFKRFFAKTGRFLLGVGRFVVRAWIMVVLVAYAVIFLAMVIGLAFTQRDSRGRGGDSSFGLFILFRVLADALFWTFHPFSPFAYSYGYGYGYGRAFGDDEQPRVRRREEGPKEPFYEKVNRFFFGPTPPVPEPNVEYKKILAEIRAQKGRIGLADVMRVTGLAREDADPLMAKILLDFDGEVDVSEEGGIAYRFEGLRKTVGDEHAPHVPPAWAEPKKMPPLTGNDEKSNAIIIGLNAFNLLMSYFFIVQEITVKRAWLMFHGVPEMKLPYDGVPIALGVVPMVFSLALFAIPIARAVIRPLKRRRIAKENGRLAILKAVLTSVKNGGVRDEDLKKRYRVATGVVPDEKELNREIARLGGDVEIGESGQVRYRFPDLEAEAKAVDAEREAAAEEEAKVGPVIFSSDA